MHQSETLLKASPGSLMASVKIHTELALLCRSEMMGMKAGSDVMRSDAWPKVSLSMRLLKTCTNREIADNDEHWHKVDNAVQ